jgi:hypothetical protein
MTVWVTQEPTRRIDGQVVSMFERDAAEKHGPVKMLIGSNAKIEDPSVQKELWENVAQIMISALHPGKLQLMLYRSKDQDKNGKLVNRPNYRDLVLDIEASRPDELCDE